VLKRYKDKKVDRDWLNNNFPCMMACPAHTWSAWFAAAAGYLRPLEGAILQEIIDLVAVVNAVRVDCQREPWLTSERN
jgi:hypothetical protein